MLNLIWISGGGRGLARGYRERGEGRLKGCQKGGGGSNHTIDKEKKNQM